MASEKPVERLAAFNRAKSPEPCDNHSLLQSVLTSPIRPRSNKREPVREGNNPKSLATIPAKPATSSSTTTGNPASGTAPPTRKRRPGSCVLCRKKRLRCNRASPCDQCERLEQECIWEGALPLVDHQEHARETAALRQQVAHLQAVVDSMTHNKVFAPSIPLPVSLATPLSTGTCALSCPSQNDLCLSRSSGSSPQDSPSVLSSAALVKDERLLDLRAHDLCEALSHIAIQDIAASEHSGTRACTALGQEARALIKEVEAFVFSDTSMTRSRWLASDRRFGKQQRGGSLHVGRDTPSRSSPESPEPEYVSPLYMEYPRESTTIAELVKLLPPHAQTLSAYTYYAGYVSWYQVIHLPSIERKWQEMTAVLLLPEGPDRDAQIDPFFVASFLGVCATGLAMMPSRRALRDGFDVNKQSTVDRWLEIAMKALNCGRFLERPSLEGVRAASILATYGVFLSAGDSFGAGMALFGLASQAALSIGLHRDPDKTPGCYTFFEAEDRRRVFYSLFTSCVLASSAIGRTWTTLDINLIDTRLPLDAYDHEIEDEELAKLGLQTRAVEFSETPITSLLLRMQLALISKRIGDAAFGIKAIAYRTVLDFDLILNGFERKVPPCYQLQMDASGALARRTAHITVTEMRACMLQISLATEFLRLHRPFLVLAARDSTYLHSKDQCIYYAKLVLAIYGSPSCNQQPWGGLTSKAIAAAVVLSMACIAFPGDPEKDLYIRLVNGAASQMELYRTGSAICTKGLSILRYLQKQAAFRQVDEMAPDSNKRRKALDLFTTLAAPNTTISPAIAGRSLSDDEFGGGEAQLSHTRLMLASQSNAEASPVAQRRHLSSVAQDGAVVTVEDPTLAHRAFQFGALAQREDLRNRFAFSFTL